MVIALITAAHVWRLRGLEGSFAKPSTCCLLWTSEQETPARRKHCHSHTQVLPTILFNPYEDKPTSLSPVLGKISYDCLRFLITHNPTNAQLGRFIEDLKAYGVNTLVRVCAATYDKAPVEQEGIQVLDWPFDDGSAPPDQVVDDWLNLLQTKFRDEPGCCVAVHCVAGLGRSWVALALIECDGIEDAS
ncbi:protein tyrosine phosphatase type IVA 2-like protein [Lates japonicus]|uniref:Protein tyrosine phosphatase type IVA 3 n=1 Tax=Lates japonicus TaxID=270547 RepID=A0AAD3MLZ0_LATJO|nr:protein tyrosine phosphatase type IVA 2-like protein [Lates japonicus]